MITWSFTLRLNRAPRDDELDALYEAGLDDAVCEGELLHVDRDASSLLDAAWSAARDVAKVPGLLAVRVVWDDAVTLRDVAQRLGRTYESVRLLAEGDRGPGGFPAPLVVTSAGRVWSWVAVAAWLDQHPSVRGEDMDWPDRTGPAVERALQVRAADGLIQVAAAYAQANPADRERIASVLHEVA